MSEFSKYSEKSFKWYEHDQEKNDPKVINSTKNLSTQWNNNRPVVTKFYTSSLEDHANTQLILIDRIMKRLDELQFENTNSNGYAYNSPSHENVVCFRGGKTNPSALSFTVHKNGVNNFSSIVPSKPVEKPINLNPVQTPELDKFLNRVSSKESIDSVEKLLEDFQKPQGKTPEKRSSISKTSTKNVNSSPVKSLINPKSNERRRSSKLVTIPEVPPPPPVLKKNGSQNVSPVSIGPSPPAVLIKIESQNDSRVVVGPPPPPPAPPLTGLNTTKKIEFRTSSDDDTSRKLPDNFLKELVEKKKSLKHSEETNKTDEKKNEREVGFIEELKDHLRKIKENSSQGIQSEPFIKPKIEEVKDEPEENKFTKNLKKVHINQETQTDQRTTSSRSSSSISSSSKNLKSSSKRSSHSSASIVSSTKEANEGEFKIISIDKKRMDSSSSKKTSTTVRAASSSTNSYKNTSSESSFSSRDSRLKLKDFDYNIKSGDILKKDANSDQSKFVDEYNTAESSLASSRRSSVKSFNKQKVLISEDERSIKKPFKEDFTLNIFYDNFPQDDDTIVPVVYKCHPTETNARLKNVLIKLHLDLESYSSMTHNKELDLMVKAPGESQANSFEEPYMASNYSFQKTESESNFGNDSFRLGSREAFFENFRQMIVESQDETDTDFQNSFQNLNIFYNNLLKKFQNKYQLRPADSVDKISSVISEGEADSFGQPDQASQTQFSDSSVVQSDMNEFSDLYRAEQKKIRNFPKSSYVVAIEEISEENSSDTIFRPPSKKIIENASCEKMNIDQSSGMDERPLPKPSKTLRSRSRADTLSQERMNISSTDSDDTVLKPIRKTPTKYFKSRLNSTDLDKIYTEEEKKFTTSQHNLDKSSNNENTSRIWSEITKTEKEIGRPKSVQAEEYKREEKERPKSVVFVEEVIEIEDKKDPSTSNLVRIIKDVKEIEEKKKDENDRKGLGQIYKHQEEKGLKRIEVKKKNEERSNLFIILDEAKESTKQRSKMQAYEQSNVEYRAAELEKIIEIDDYKSFTSKSKSPSVSSQSSSIELKSKEKKKAPPPPPATPQSNLIPEKEEKKPQSKVENLIQKFEPIKRDPSLMSVSTNSEVSNKDTTRIGGLMLAKDVQIETRKKLEAENPIKETKEPVRPFSNQASNILDKLKGSLKKDETPMRESSIKLNEDEKKNLFVKNQVESKNVRSKLVTEFEPDTKSLLSEKLPELDVYSRSSLQYQDDSSKRSTIKSFMEKSDTSKSDSSSYENDFDQYFQLENETDDREIQLPPKLKSEELEPAKKRELNKIESFSSDDYALPKNISLLNLKLRPESEKRSETPKFLEENQNKNRDSSLLDKILLKQSDVNPDDEKYFKDRSNLSPNDTLLTSKRELEEAEKLIQNKRLLVQRSTSESFKSYNSDNEQDQIIPVGPTPETIEIINRLRQNQSVSANPQLFNSRRISSELTRENKLSGGKQRKPNEETITLPKDQTYKRTKSSNSMNTHRNSIFSKLFGRDKLDQESKTGTSLGGKKKKDQVKK